MPNKPKIISNELDQVVKKGERYRQELLKEDISQKIREAFDGESGLPMWENDFFIDWESDKLVIDWFLENSKHLPVEQVWKMLKEKNIISCELFREKKWKTGDWNKTVWPAISIENISLWSVLTQKDLPIDGYDITYITFTKIKTEWWPYVRISIQQVGFPIEWAQLPKYVVFHNELKGKDIEKLKDISIGSVLEE
jgi:hypothetical protein